MFVKRLDPVEGQELAQRSVGVPLQRPSVELPELDWAHVGGDEGGGQLNGRGSVLQQGSACGNLDEGGRFLGLVELVVADVEGIPVVVLGRGRRTLLFNHCGAKKSVNKKYPRFTKSFGKYSRY